MRASMRIALFALAIYLGLYVRFRNQWVETWDRDGSRYVIFPEDSVWAYYVFRPLSYLDGLVTGVGSHIGPHG